MSFSFISAEVYSLLVLMLAIVVVGFIGLYITAQMDPVPERREDMRLRARIAYIMQSVRDGVLSKPEAINRMIECGTPSDVLQRVQKML